MPDFDERDVAEQESWRTEVARPDPGRCEVCGRPAGGGAGLCRPHNYGTVFEPVVCYLCPDCMADVERFQT